MIDPDSRYYSLETKTYTRADGGEISYKARRFVPPGSRFEVLTEETVGQGDRIDQVTSRTLGDPLLFWRVCDANNAINPGDLVSEAGSALDIPVPDFDT